jgi:uncharacterized membrane protein
VALAGCGGAGEEPATDTGADPGEAGVPGAVAPSGARDGEAPPFPVGITGVLGARDGGFSFQPCGEDEALPVTDGTGGDLAGLLEELGYGAGEVAVHLVLDGTMVTEVRVAAPESSSCTDLLPEAELRARGNEPFWLVDVEGPHALFRSPEELEGIRYDEGHWEATALGWRYEALQHHVDGMGYLTLEVEEGRCLDSMSGAWFPFTASLRKGGERYTGCAWEGRR